MLNKSIVLAAAVVALIFTLSAGHAAKPGKGDGGGGGTGGGEGTGGGHSHNDLEDLINSISLTPGPQRPAGAPGPACADGQDVADCDLGNCVAVMTQMGFDERILLKNDTTEINGSNANHIVNNCPMPYSRTGATCLCICTRGYFAVGWH